MTPIPTPPPVLCFARLLAYARVDESVEFTGRQHLYVDDELLGRVPCLALCQNVAPEENEIMLFHCDEQWNVLGVGGRREEARRWLEQQYPEDMCSFCGRLPFEFEAAFGGHRCTICEECVRKFFAMLQKGKSDSVE